MLSNQNPIPNQHIIMIGPFHYGLWWNDGAPWNWCYKEVMLGLLLSVKFFVS